MDSNQDRRSKRINRGPQRSLDAFGRWIRAREARFVGIALVGLLIYLVYFGVRVSSYQQVSKGGPRGDFGIYYKAGGKITQGLPIFSLEDGPYLTYKYAPIVALGSSWLPVFSPPVARLLWFGLDVAALWGIVILARRILYENSETLPDSSIFRASWWLAGAAFLITLRYVGNQLHAGHTTHFMFLFVVAAFRALQRDRAYLAGIVLAPAICFKLVPLCVVPLFLIQRRWWPGLVTFVAAFGFLLIVPAIRVGWAANWELVTRWPVHLAETNVPSLLFRPHNIGVTGVLTRVLCEEESHAPEMRSFNLYSFDLSAVSIIWAVLAGGFALLLYGFCFQAWRSDWRIYRTATALSLFLTYMAAFNPLAWRMNFVVLIVPTFVILDSLRTTRTGRTVRILLLVLGILFSQTPIQTETSSFLNSLSAYGARLCGAIFICLGAFLAFVSANRTMPARESNSIE